MDTKGKQKKKYFWQYNIFWLNIKNDYLSLAFIIKVVSNTK